MGDGLDAATRPRPASRLFTVGIPVYNGKSLLRRCLQSVISSTLPRDRFEIVIADDGSTESETLTILTEFQTTLAADPGFFRVITMDSNSGGAARPRNRILDVATGEYVFFVDADDTIGDQALERISEALAASPADWVAVNQVAVNGRATVFAARRPLAEVPRVRALSTLTVHKVFRRAEIERQRLRFDEGLPSGQDVAFAFSFIMQASKFLVLGGYDFYRLTQHGEKRDEPAHLSRRARSPEEIIEKNERILRSMLASLRASDLPERERQEIVSRVVLPRILIRQRHLASVVNAGPDAGARALRRLSGLLAEAPLAGLDPAGAGLVTAEHLDVIASADWPGLARIVGRADLVEVARGRPYELSSAYGTSSPTGTVQPSTGYFFHTDFGHGQSIRVDLGRRQRVRRIEVTNRRGGYQQRARHIVAVLSDGAPGKGTGRVFPIHQLGSLPDGAWQECGIDVPDVAAQFVTITSPMNTALHFADLRVYATADLPAEPTRARRLARRAVRTVRTRLRRQPRLRRSRRTPRAPSARHQPASPAADSPKPRS